MKKITLLALSAFIILTGLILLIPESRAQEYPGRIGHLGPGSFGFSGPGRGVPNPSLGRPPGNNEIYTVTLRHPTTNVIVLSRRTPNRKIAAGFQKKFQNYHWKLWTSSSKRPEQSKMFSSFAHALKYRPPGQVSNQRILKGRVILRKG